MKKKILIIMPSLFIGGAERSLLGLLEAFAYEKNDVYLFLYRHEGEFLKHIPEQVHLLSQIDEYTTFDVPIKSLLLSKKILFGIGRLASKLACKIHCILRGEQCGVWMNMQYISRYLQPLLPDIPGKYDMGIMFLGVADTLLNKVSAKKKVTWCHTDYDTLCPDKKMDLQTYSKVDYLVAVSEKCEEKIKAFYPMIESKIITIENILASGLIAFQAEEIVTDMPKINGQYTLLSIGRFCTAKNFDNVPWILKGIRENGIDAKWYIIGYGGDESLICKKIAEAGMQEHVIMLGKKENPYPYIKACDIYVQPSRYEGKCVSVIEAQMLHKPVIITNYATSKSQLEDVVDGVIVPIENEKCAEGICRVIKDKELQKTLIDNTKKRDYTNKSVVEKIYKLME